MTETSLEKVVQERQFVQILQAHAEELFRLSNTLLVGRDSPWNRKHYFQLISETELLESFLDDFGARYNRTFATFTALIASLRWFAHAGYSVVHHLSRLESYGALEGLDPPEAKGAVKGVYHAAKFIQDIAVRLLEALRSEALLQGVELPAERFSDGNFLKAHVRRRLPRNVGQSDPENEEQKIVEAASKYLQACELLSELGIRQIEDPEERAQFLRRRCTEEQARVYEATVHNLQSAYDTHIRNTILESRDDRLPRLRGHGSAALHLLEAVTHLTHFIERHEDDLRSEDSKRRIREIVDRREVQQIVLNHLLHWANRFLQSGAKDAAELLPTYTNVRELVVTLPTGISLHARPVALIVGIVNQHAVPVEMEVGGEKASAGSILKLLMMVGSHPEDRTFLFRGDERPLDDIRRLFESGLGEAGLDTLPRELDYLRTR